MAHMKRFAAISMSKRMRDMCKEEDYVFLNCQETEEQAKIQEESTLQEWEGHERKEERLRRQLEREHQEQERQCELEKQKREKKEQWKSQVAKLASDRESLPNKLHRLHEFRAFQKKVLMQDLSLDPTTSNEKLTNLFMRL